MKTEAQNVTTRVEGSKLIVEIDLDVRVGPSATGRTTIVAKHNGKLPVSFGDFGASFTVYVKE